MREPAPDQALPRAGRAVIVIPARAQSTRFPGKPLTPLRGRDGTAKPLVERSWLAACGVGGADEILVATDDGRIFDRVSAFGAKVVLTSPNCRNGTERCWDAVSQAGIDADIIVNLQGDAPLTPPLAVEALIGTMRGDPSVRVASAMTRCSREQVERLVAQQREGLIGGTTVVVDRAMDALYFSRQLLPHGAWHDPNVPMFLHLGLYGYRREALALYAAAPMPDTERCEGLEQLRFLDMGVPIRMIEVTEPPGGLWEVNNPSDVALVEAALGERGLV